jgi:hypothetical protein
MSSMSGATGAGMGNKIPRGYKLNRLQNFTPEQMQLFQSLFGHVGPDSFLSKIAGGDEEAFNQIERPALQGFTGQMGNLASRFSGMGLGGRHSSGFQNTATAAGADFAQNLASQRHGLQRQALMDLMGISESLLGQRPYENFLSEKKPSFLESIMGSLGGGLGQGAGQASGMALIAKLLPFLGF